MQEKINLEALESSDLRYVVGYSHQAGEQGSFFTARYETILPNSFVCQRPWDRILDATHVRG